MSGDGEADPDGTFAFGLPTEWDGDGTFETQRAYLRRLKLLLPREGSPIREPHPGPPVAREFWQAYRWRPTWSTMPAINTAAPSCRRGQLERLRAKDAA